ncbi:MAG: tetratricopeptide repeat protein [Pseudomonadota bacterium]
MRYLTSTFLRRLIAVVLCSAIAACASGPGPQQRDVRSDSGNSEAVEIPQAIASDYANAQTLLSVEDYAGAVQILEPLAQSAPEYPAIATTLAIAWRQMERSDDALAMLQSTLAVHDGYAPGWNEVGILHREAGRFADAEAAYLKAVTVNPDYALAHFNLGILLDLYLAQHSRALEHYERYQALVPDEDKQVKRWIADISRRIERTARAASVSQ